jgi:hypothetical protein
MPIPVFEQQATIQAAEQIETKKEKISPWSVFFSILLTVILITMGEYAFQDSNRVFNPQYEACHVSISFNSMRFLQKTGSPQENCEMRAYASMSLLLHADISAPLLLIGIVILLLTRKKAIPAYLKAVFFSCSVFIVWMSIRVIYETESFLVKHYPLAGKYVVFMTIAIICVALIVIIQGKLRRKPAAA